MKKNLLAITACFMACLLLAGCGAARNETGSSQPSETLTGAETTAASETTAKESWEVASVTEPTAKTTETAISNDSPVVYFTSDITAEGLAKIYEALNWTPEGKVAVKISTGEPPASNYLRPELIGSFISVFAKDKIHGIFAGMRDKKWGLFGIIPACILGIASPLCMYGTIPIAASFRKQGMREDWLAAFMMASILLNPQLIIYSMALGSTALAVRIITCFLCGCAACLLVFLFYRDRNIFGKRRRLFRTPKRG